MSRLKILLHLLKQFEGLVTDWEKMFSRARLRLTGWYLAIIMLVSLMFSVVIYREVTAEMERFEQAQRARIERRLREGGLFPLGAGPGVVVFAPELLEEARGRVVLALVLINGGILVGAGGLGWFLAGRTLFPIARMVEEQNRFVADASHELRTPLTGLKTTLEVFLREKRPSLREAREVVKASLGEVGRLQSLSESLLELNGGKGGVWEKVKMAEVVGEAVERVRGVAAMKKIKIERDVSDFVVNGEKRRLVGLVAILLDNAVKYSLAGKKVWVKAGKGQLRVVDQGEGISKQDLPRVFDRFYRAERSRNREGVGGFGLGLSIAKKIVEDHGGKISIESRLGKGTRVSVDFQEAKV